MSYSKNINCCYFPTTTVLVDDNSEFLEMASFEIEQFSPCKLFEYPAEALEFISDKYTKKPFFYKFFSYSEESSDNDIPHLVSVDFSKIYKQIYDPNRFLEITGLLVDYAMPGMNGEEFCHEILKRCSWKDWNNIILLTGEAESDTVTKMLKKGLINGCIFKRDPNYLDDLVKMMRERQLAYFGHYSNLFTNLITHNMSAAGMKSSCFKDPIFIDFFHKMVEQYKPIEYYLINESGSYIFLSDTGKISWLIVQSEDDMKSAEFDMVSDATVPPNFINAIKERKAIRYFFNEEYFPEVKNAEEWKKYIYSAQKIEGISNYYYSYIENPLAETFIDQNRVVPYNSYRNSVQIK